MVVSQLGLIIEKQQTEESIPVPSPFKPSLVGNAQTDSFPDLVQKKSFVRMCCRMPTPCQVIKSDTIRKRQSTGAILARIVQQCLGQVGVVLVVFGCSHDMMSPGCFGWFMSIAKHHFFGDIPRTKRLKRKSSHDLSAVCWCGVSWLGRVVSRWIYGEKTAPKRCNSHQQFNHSSLGSFTPYYPKNESSKFEEWLNIFCFANWNLLREEFHAETLAPSWCNNGIQRNVTKTLLLEER